MGTSQEDRILDAVKECCTRFGVDKVTFDDIAATSGVSRATIYRLFPGGREVLFEALRVRELNEFFTRLTGIATGIADFDELVIQLVVAATRDLRNDEQLALMLASEPGQVVSQMTVAGLPRTIRVANLYLQPLLRPHLDPAHAATLIDLLVRITLSYFLTPSELVDLGDEESASDFLRPALRALVPPEVRRVPSRHSTLSSPEPREGTPS
jgi:TetR/AcrR family transcriptional repressor of uid operon